MTDDRQRLEDALLEAEQAGLLDHVTPPEDEEARRSWEEHNEELVESCESVSDWAAFAPVAKRGLATHFDAEGSFFIEGHHADLVEEQLETLGIQVDVRDQWVSETGWLVSVEEDGETTHYFSGQSLDRPSDYVESEMVFTVVNNVLGRHDVPFQLVNLVTGDQTAFYALLPSQVLETIRRDDLLHFEDGSGIGLPPATRRVEASEAEGLGFEI